MKVVKQPTGNRMVLIVNQLKEHSEAKIDQTVSVDSLLKNARKQKTHRLYREDIFIGEACTQQKVMNRLEEYCDLSLLRRGSLEILYYCPFTLFTEFFVGHDQDHYLHFYDCCLKESEIKIFLKNFSAEFDVKFRILNSTAELFNRVENRESSLSTSHSAHQRIVPLFNLSQQVLASI